MTLPPFATEWLLPPGDYPLTLVELQASHLVTGQGVGSPTWDAAWRAALVGNIAVLAGQLWQVGITRVFVDGSFVEDKDHPHDIDGYFECDLHHLVSGDLERDLNRLDPNHVWTWDPASRQSDPNSAKAQLPMWHCYRVELYPHYGQFCGITDQYGHELEFPSAFRQSRHGFRPKGIVRLVQ
jgi:uncharacterized protein DUF6932